MHREAHTHGTADKERLAVIRSLWSEVLGVDTVPDDTNFYDIGGDSLRLVALVEQIRRSTGLPVRAVDVLRAGTVRKQAELLAGFGSPSR